MSATDGKDSVEHSTQTDDSGSKNKRSLSTAGSRKTSIFFDSEVQSLMNFANFESVMACSMSRVFKRQSTALGVSQMIIDAWSPKQTLELLEKFPVNVTSLMNEENKWGCFYNFPEIYEDEYSPVVRIRELEDVPPIEGGVLTRDLVTACLTYLKRTPILGDFAYIKLDLSSKQLSNIDVLQHYKYLVYLNLSYNLLKELTVLSHLLYLQHINVSFNRLGTILEYDTPQWFLTEVHYKFNSVKKINDLSMFWSITVLDLSHNNIKCITGLQQLRYLRRLDLSFNHIQRLENLNHLRLLWLDISYNNISSCEFSENTGLWTLLHLEYLNLNENNLISLKMFSGCNRIRELYLRNNRLGILLELAVYMKQMRRLVVLELRANPMCSSPVYKDVIINTFPLLLKLDAQDLDPVEQRSLKMDMFPDVTAHATRRLLRLLYIEQLSRSLVSPFIPPADTTDVPLVVLVGLEAVGKGTLARRLTSECSSNMQLARLHTTSTHHFAEHFIEVTRSKFDAMLLAGDFLTYSEIDGESYGLSREEAFVTDGRVRIVSLDLVGALMLKLRGYRPYLILATAQDKRELAKKQHIRKTYRETYHLRHTCTDDAPMEHLTLQVLVSGRIIITGILNEIILNIPDDKLQSEFTMESECSLMMDSEIRNAIKDYAKHPDFFNLDASDLSLQDINKRVPYKSANNEEPSLYSLFKESQATEEYNSCVSYRPEQGKKSIDKSKAASFSRYASGTWKEELLSCESCDESSNNSLTLDGSTSSIPNISADGNNQQTADLKEQIEHLTIQLNSAQKEIGALTIENSKLKTTIQELTTSKQEDILNNTSKQKHDYRWLSAGKVDSTKSAKSVTFTSQDGMNTATGMLIEPKAPATAAEETIHSISTRGPLAAPGQHTQRGLLFVADSDLWLAFLTEAGEREASDTANQSWESIGQDHPNVCEPDSMMHQFHSRMVPIETIENLEAMHTLPSAHLREQYESIHRRNPGLFWDTVTMDNLDEAFKKVRRIIGNIVKNQSNFKPMFDIDFPNLKDYPSVQKRLDSIRKQIAPQQLFY